MIEYWEPSEPFEKPESVEWQNKAQTGLYEFKKVSPHILFALSRLLGPSERPLTPHLRRPNPPPSPSPSPLPSPLSPSSPSLTYVSLPSPSPPVACTARTTSHCRRRRRCSRPAPCPRASTSIRWSSVDGWRWRESWRGLLWSACWKGGRVWESDGRFGMRGAISLSIRQCWVSRVISILGDAVEGGR